MNRASAFAVRLGLSHAHGAWNLGWMKGVFAAFAKALGGHYLPLRGQGFTRMR